MTCMYFHQGLYTLVLSFYTENYIDGTEFVGLTECEIKEIVPPIGLAKKIMKLVPKVSRYFYPTISRRVLVTIYYNLLCSD